METTFTASIESEKIMAELGLSAINNGACTGTNWIKTNGEILDSCSPADGQLIAKINQATKEDYETIIATAQDRKSTRLNSSHVSESRMPSSA